MVEICGKLDKSNTYLKFRFVIFRSALFHLPELLHKECEEKRGCIVVVGKVGRELKSNVSDFIKDFLF